MQSNLEAVIDRLLSFLTGTRRESEHRQAERKAIIARTQDSLAAIGDTLSYRLQKARQDPTLTVELSGLVSPEDRLPNDFPKNFRFVVGYGDLQLQGEDKLLDFDEDSALVEAFKLTLDLPAQQLRVEVWEIGEVDSLYSEAEIEMTELEHATQLVFTNGVHLQLHVSFSENALGLLRSYTRVQAEISKELQQLSASTQASRKKLADRRLKLQAKRQKFTFVQPQSLSYQDRVTQIDQILGLLNDGVMPLPPEPLQEEHQFEQSADPVPERPSEQKITEVDEEEEDSAQ